MVSKQETRRLKELDRELLDTFVARCPKARRKDSWRNGALRRLIDRGFGERARFGELQKILEEKGLFDIRIERRRWVDSDGERRTHTLARAAVTDMWPMGTHYWLRDNAIIGARFLRARDARRRRIGRDLLLSGLSFISSVAQLKRFRMMVRSRSPRFARDAANWPYIFAGVNDNLTCDKPEPWAHKQDAWQILAWHVMEALRSGDIARADLTAKHREFLGLIVPFLVSVSFWRCENSGSWEEISAVRTSVRAWEHRLIALVGERSTRREFSFLNRIYLRERRYLPKEFRQASVRDAVARLERKVVPVMISSLPYEAASYQRRESRYRKGDGALLYLLELDYISFLAERSGKGVAWARRMEERVLQQVLALQDSRSGGIARYGNDSYQRHGFFRYLTVAKLNELYGAPSGDASSHFAGRDAIVPRGRKAAWTHFVWQVASWAGERFIATGEKHYRMLHERFFLQGLRLVTGSGERSIDLTSKGTLRIISIPAWRMPECYIADADSQGRELVFPSPHTPLNWATAEMLAACGVRERVLRRF